METLTVTSLFAAIFGLLFIAFTLRVGLYRRHTRISLGDGGNKELNYRIRAHGNFVETTPIALILLALMEVAGAHSVLLYSLGSLLLVARLSHYCQISGFLKPLLFRAGAMVGTFIVYLIASIWLLINAAF